MRAQPVILFFDQKREQDESSRQESQPARRIRGKNRAPNIAGKWKPMRDRQEKQDR